jgi:predicted Zn-dependent protease
VRAARAPYDRAYALTRSEVDVISRYAVYSARTGRFVEADAAIARAAALDPLNSSMFKSAGNIKYAAGAYQEAIDFARQALALSPKRSTLRGDMGNAYLMLGQLDAAEAEFVQESNTLLALTGRAIVAQRRGQAAAVQERLAELVTAQGDNGLYQQAQILAQSGANDTAFAALEKAYAARDSGLVYLLNDPFLAPLRNDARYNNLLRQLKFV